MTRSILPVLCGFLAFGVCGDALAERTVGLFQNDAEAFVGYTMLAKGGTTYLIDNAGLLVHTWSQPGGISNSGYLLEDGTLLYLRNSGFIVLTWDGGVVWSYNEPAVHHDVEPLPNGNVLLIVKDVFSPAEAIAAGRDPAKLEDALKSLAIYEIEPPGQVVWEWHLWDHLIQDFDAGQENYGNVSASPELVDINYTLNSDPDWNHTNAIDFNPDLDQIIVSPRHFCELWVIDHSTSTTEAAGHSGGNAGRGGDLLYRWGNPMTYRAGTIDDRQLFGQHDTHWIEPGLPGEGHILIFNNGGSRFGSEPFSSVVEIEPPVDGFTYSHVPGTAYGPSEPVWTYQADSPTDFYSSFLSSAQRLPNGNSLIGQGANGTLFEVTPSGEIVWRYVNPVTNTGILGFDEVPVSQVNSLLRVHRYAPDHPAFKGQDLTPSSAIETYDDSVNLTLQSTAGGSVMTRGEGTFPYGVEQIVTTVAQSEPGFMFTGWTVEAGSLTLPDPSAVHSTFIMGATDAGVQANFAPAAPSVPTVGGWGLAAMIVLLAFALAGKRNRF